MDRSLVARAKLASFMAAGAFVEFGKDLWKEAPLLAKGIMLACIACNALALREPIGEVVNQVEDAKWRVERYFTRIQTEREMDAHFDRMWDGMSDEIAAALVEEGIYPVEGPVFLGTSEQLEAFPDYVVPDMDSDQLYGMPTSS